MTQEFIDNAVIDKAVIVDAAGGPEVLQFKVREEPLTPKEGELLVRTGATGVNFIETYQRSGVYAVDYPFTPGSEAAGTVVAVGPGVTRFSVGDRITTCEARGTYAESFVVGEDQAVSIPEDMSFEVAAAIPLQALTAHYLQSSSSNPNAGDFVLVHAGAGGVGLILTQLLSARGVRVITTASTPEKRAASIAAGATESIDYKDFAGKVKELTNGAGVAVVYDGVGKDTFGGSLESLQVRGKLVLFGGASGQVAPFDLQRLNSGGSLSVTRPSLVHFLRDADERAWRYSEIFDAINAGTLEIKVDASFKLADAQEAHRALESRATSGKVVLVA